jgi:hypothetical protein
VSAVIQELVTAGCCCPRSDDDLLSLSSISVNHRLLSVNCVRTTNNLPSIVVVEKLAVDHVRVAVKRQLAYLAQFVSVSPEMHQAVHYEKIDETTF